MAKFTINLQPFKENESIHYSLGISDERADELNNQAEEILGKGESYTVSMKKCVELCNTLEEVTFVIFQYGHLDGHMCEKEGSHDPGEEEEIPEIPNQIRPEDIN